MARFRASTARWKDLPVELLETVLLWVSWHDLCRYRAVCKEWNSTIMQPGFVRLHATTSLPDLCVLTAPRLARPALLSGKDRGTQYIAETDSWELLDVGAKRLFSIPDTFIREGLGTRRFMRRTLAASGGLLYAAMYSTFEEHQCHVVCNPVSKSFHQIPKPRNLCCGYHHLIVMVVETGTQRYRIVHMDGSFDSPSVNPAAPTEVRVYDSRVRVWRKLCDAPGEAYRARSCVVLNGVFYTMFEDIPRRLYELYSCDLETGAWRFIDVPLPRRPREAIKSRSQVVAASGRLFFVGFTGPVGEEVITVTVWEILPSARMVTLVTQLPRFLNFCHKPVYTMTIPAVAIAFGDSIVVSFFVGHRVRWDVVQGTWHRMPHFLPAPEACHSFFVAPLELQMREMPEQ